MKKLTAYWYRFPWQALSIGFALVIINTRMQAQQVDLEHVGKDLKGKIKNKKPVKITGGVSASSVFYKGNAGAGRDPFSYYINGNVNLSLYGISIPASFAFTNRGFSYGYTLPNVPNRLSLHPKYKWITAHIGDVSTNFSPYTLNGLLYRGGGLDLSPKGKWKYSLMGGRLQKAVEYRPDNGQTLAAYKRFGYGAKINYENSAYKWAISIFKAKDVMNSLELKPDSLQIYPQENTAVSIEESMPIIRNLVLTSEYAVSALTRDIRAPKYADSNRVNWMVKLFGGSTATNIYKAYKTELNYTIGSSMIGVGYERIDPGYQTLGAYYFNNDLENITANFAQSFFKGKINLSGNVGLQRDDLDHKKTGGSRRTVSAVNINWNASQRFTSNLSYSNFQTYTNVKPQFQYINQLTPFDNLDTLNFRQLSQNGNVNINYVVSTNKEKPQNVNLNLSFQDSYDMQGGIITEASASQFYNFAGSYNFNHSKKAMGLTGALNITYNTIGKNDMITYGPTVAVNKQFWDKQIRTNASVSYNKTVANEMSPGQQVISVRLTGGYVFKKKHNINISAVGMNRMATGKSSIYDYTGTIAYNFNF
jgi:hypothetical protein